MKAVLRVALAYFSIAPVQHWLNGSGATMLVLALATRLPGTPQPVAGMAPALVALGLMQIWFVPFMFGGAVLRFASSRSILYMRPHGRVRMLLGATLAITLVAGFATLALLSPHRATGSWHLLMSQPAAMFTLSWGCTALVWIGVFVASGSRLGMMLIWIVPAAMSWVMNRVATDVPVWPVVPLAGLLGWAGFVLWYKSANADQSWQWIFGHAAANVAAASRDRPAPAGPPEEAVSPAQAQRELLLDIASPQVHVLIGLVLLFIAQLLQAAVRHQDPDVRSMEMIILLPCAFMMMYAMLGQSAARRARLLWLRAGTSRAGLFLLAERRGLTTTAIGLGIPLLAMVPLSLLYRPELVATTALLVMLEAAFAIALFYWGMSLTRGRLRAQIPQMLLAILLIISQVPVVEAEDTRIAVMAWELGLLMIIGPLLRWHARRRWLLLDWQVMRLPPRIPRPN